MNAPVRNVLGVIGSLRADSFNRRLLYHAAAIAPERLPTRCRRLICIRLPLFDEDLEADGLPADVVSDAGAHPRRRRSAAGHAGVQLRRSRDR